MLKAKQILKEHGVKGFRKLKLKRIRYVAGKQCSFLNPHIAKNLLNRLVAECVSVSDLQTCIELAEKGLLDTITLEG